MSRGRKTVGGRPAIAAVYALSDPADGRIYYVGATKHVARRVSQHLKGQTATSSPQVGAWVRRVQAEGRTPQVRILEEHPSDGLLWAERRWIRRCLAQHEPLLNVIRPNPPQQLRRSLPFSAEEKARFPLRRWLEAKGITRATIARALGLRMAYTLDSLLAGVYEYSGQTPGPIVLAEIKTFAALTGLPVELLLFPCRSLHRLPCAQIGPRRRLPRPRLLK